MEIGFYRFRNRYIDSVFLVLSFGWLNWSWSGKHVYCLAEFMSVHLCWTSSTDVQADNPHFMAPNKIWIFEQIKVSYDSIRMASWQYSIQHVIKPIKSFYMTHSISCPKKPKDQFWSSCPISIPIGVFGFKWSFKLNIWYFRFELAQNCPKCQSMLISHILAKLPIF